MKRAAPVRWTLFVVSFVPFLFRDWFRSGIGACVCIGQSLA